jgi:predicted phosphodiesterase
MSRRKIDPARLAELLKRPLTVAELADELKMPGLDAERIRQLSLPTGHTLFEQKNEHDDSVFVCAPQVSIPGVKPRQWAIWHGNPAQPYIWIQFPANIKLKRIKLAPLSDIHYGAKAHDFDRFNRYLRWIERNDDVFTFLNGDIIENAIDGSVGGSAYESLMTPAEQIWGSDSDPKNKPGIINLLRPIAHKILWAQPGNHEWRTWKKTNIDPLRIICGELNIPYFDEPIFADVLAFGHRFTFHCQHGHTNSQTKGGKMNAANRPAEYQEAVDFVIMGHIHDSMANPVTRIVRKREFNSKGDLVGFRLEERAQYTVICPSFYGYFGSYGARAGYAPGSWGAVTCTLYRDGGYRASE